jgi:hypothetical protein
MKFLILEKSSKIYNVLLFFLPISFLFSCSNMNKDYIDGQTDEGFEDGTYCAEVNYYNPNTGTSSTYTLEVEVYNNEVVQINWNNGGWLDEDHFTASSLDEYGTCSFTSYNGYDYTVEIVGKNCSFLDSKDEMRSLSLPKYTFEQASSILNMTQQEINECDICDEDELLSENDFNILKDYLDGLRIYLKEMRELDDEYKSIDDIKRAQRKMQNEINEGYIISKRTHSFGENRNTTLKIRKRGIVYLLEVQGNSECTMGTAIFDENNLGWQMVYIKQYPDRDEFNGHYMRIIEKSID